MTRCPDRVSGTASDPAPHPMSSTLSPGRTSASFRKSRAYGRVSRGRKCRARAFQKSGESGDLRTRCNFFHSSFQSVSSNVARTGPSPVQPQSPTRSALSFLPSCRHGRVPRRPHPRALRPAGSVRLQGICPARPCTRSDTPQRTEQTAKPFASLARTEHRVHGRAGQMAGGPASSSSC